MLQVITRGELEHKEDIMIRWYEIGGQAIDEIVAPYVGRTLVICLEEKEPEPSPMKMVAVPA